MLTYFLEGEDAIQRQRRISNTKRLSTPNGDLSDVENIFGAPTIDRKYWPHGTGSVTTVPELTCETICDNSTNDIPESHCDNNCVNLNVLDEVFKSNKPFPGPNSHRLSSKSDHIILSDTNPFKNHRVRMCLSEPGEVPEVISMTSDGESDVFDKAPVNKIELSRMTSLPVQIAEDVV